MKAERKRRALFREVNSRIQEINRAFGVDIEAFHLLCECGRAGCVERIEVPATLAEEIRTAERYVVVPGHEQQGLDGVVGGNGRYRIVSPQPAVAGA